MLNKIGFKERGSEKILSVEEIDPDRIRLFLLNRAGTESRMHIDITASEVKLLIQMLSESTGVNQQQCGSALAQEILAEINRAKYDINRLIGCQEEVSRYAILMDLIKRLCEKQLAKVSEHE